MQVPTQHKYSVSTYALLDMSLREAVIHLIDGGWRDIEIMCEGRHGELLEWPKVRLAWLKQIGEENGVRWTLHAPIIGLNPAAVDADEVRSSRELLLRTLHIAEELECSYIVVHPGEIRVDEVQEYSNDELEQRVASFLRDILVATAGFKVVIALENVPPYPGLLGSDAKFLVRVHQLVGSPRLGIVFDVGHAHMTGDGQCLLALQRLLPHVIGLHLSDNSGVHDDHWQLGAGTVPLEEVVSLTHAYRYTGAWVIEMRTISDVRPSVEWLSHRRR